MALLFGWLWEWVDRASVMLLVPSPPPGGRLTETERQELRSWVEDAPA